MPHVAASISRTPWLEALYCMSVMPRLDQEALRRYARRDWLAPARRARVERARLPIERKVQLAIELYEAARATSPGWPDEVTRRADLDNHLRLKAMLDRAAHVGAC